MKKVREVLTVSPVGGVDKLNTFRIATEELDPADGSALASDTTAKVVTTKLKGEGR